MRLRRVPDSEALRNVTERAEEAETALDLSRGECAELKAAVVAIGDGAGSEVLFRLQHDLVACQASLRLATAKLQPAEERAQALAAAVVEPTDAKAAADAQLADAEAARDALKLTASAARVKQMEAEKFESGASEEAVKLRQALNFLEQQPRRRPRRWQRSTKAKTK